MAEIRVIARLVAKPEKIGELRSLAQSMLKPTHQETGNKFYELYESTEGGRFLFNELWVDQDAFDGHLATPHFKHFKASIQDLLAQPLELNFLNEIR